jgi:hypothetical protein
MPPFCLFVCLFVCLLPSGASYLDTNPHNNDEDEDIYESFQIREELSPVPIGKVKQAVLAHSGNSSSTTNGPPPEK